MLTKLRRVDEEIKFPRSWLEFLREFTVFLVNENLFGELGSSVYVLTKYKGVT